MTWFEAKGCARRVAGKSGTMLGSSFRASQFLTEAIWRLTTTADSTCVLFLAGWRRTTMPELPGEDEPIRIVPDWVCAVLSPSNARYDRSKKLPYYARVGVAWAWLIDVRDRTLEVRELQAGAWVERRVVSSEERLRLPPFEAIEIPLARLWVATPSDYPGPTSRSTRS